MILDTDDAQGIEHHPSRQKQVSQHDLDVMASNFSYVHYERMAAAIIYIQQHYQHQPSLDEIAKHVHLSATHFQKIFSTWAGTSPKKFVQYLSLMDAKQRLRQNQSILNVAHDTGFSSSSRLHDLFIQIEGMTPAEYKHAGAHLVIHYQFAETLFGQVLIASTEKGICHLMFVEADEAQALADLKLQFAQAEFIQATRSSHTQALAILQQPITHSALDTLKKIKLHLKGTDFQLKVWQSLLHIPTGKLSTYANIAEQIEQPKANRAVGTAIGKNPVAFLIPCHRVIQSSGGIGGYMWGHQRKSTIIAWEAMQQNLLD